MADTVLQAATACPKSHSATTLLDAFQDGRITRDELLDHLLEWRKVAPGETAKPVKLHHIQDHLFEVGGIVSALRLMYQGLDDEDAEHAFCMIVENLDERIDTLKVMAKECVA